MVTDFDAIKQSAEGKWIGILRSLGITIREDGKHGPCPICGGKDRFRFDDRDGRGTHICNNCGAGDGFELVKKCLGVDFKAALEAVSDVVGKCAKYTVPKEPKITKETLRKIFLDSVVAKKDNLVGEYLKNRGLSIVPKCLRFSEKCWEPETKAEQNAMLAVFMSSNDEALTMHRTFLGKDGRKLDIEKPKKLLPALRKMTGGAIRLFEHDGILGITEGIETAIAAYELTKIPTWAAVSDTLMAGFEPPNIKELHIFADNDANFAGQQAAFTLAKRIKMTQDTKNIDVFVRIPEKTGTDFLDVLNEG